MTENKKEFVKKLEELLKTTRTYGDIEELVLTDDENYIYAMLEDGHLQRQVFVAGDNCAGILYDFVRQYDKAPWLRSFNKEFLKRNERS